MKNSNIRLGRDVEMAIGFEPRWASPPVQFTGLIAGRESLNSQQQWHRPPQLGSGLHAEPSRLIQASVGGDLHFAPTAATLEILLAAIIGSDPVAVTTKADQARYLRKLSIPLVLSRWPGLRPFTYLEPADNSQSICILRRLRNDARWQSFDGLVPRQLRLGSGEGRRLDVIASFIGKQVTSLGPTRPQITDPNSRQIFGFDGSLWYHKFKTGRINPVSGTAGPMVTSWQLDISRTGTRPLFDLSGTAPRAIAAGLLAVSGQVRFVIEGDAAPQWCEIGRSFTIQIAAQSGLDQSLLIDLPHCHITSSRTITQTGDDVVVQVIGFELRRAAGTALFQFILGAENASS